MSKEEVLLNDEIRFSEVRCIDDDGEVYGIISSREAKDLAQERGLDLVCVSPNANPLCVKSWTMANTATN